MKTYLWCDSDQNAFEYDFVAVMAESLDRARELAVKEVCRAYEEKLNHELSLLDDWHNNYHLEERDARCIVINTTSPVIIEPDTASLLPHANY